MHLQDSTAQEVVSSCTRQTNPDALLSTTEFVEQVDVIPGIKTFVDDLTKEGASALTRQASAQPKPIKKLVKHKGPGGVITYVWN